MKRCVICKKYIWPWQHRFLANAIYSAVVRVHPPAHITCLMRGIDDKSIYPVRGEDD